MLDEIFDTLDQMETIRNKMNEEKPMPSMVDCFMVIGGVAWYAYDYVKRQFSSEGD